jgi:hypothetical protein
MGTWRLIRGGWWGELEVQQMRQERAHFSPLQLHHAQVAPGGGFKSFTPPRHCLSLSAARRRVSGGGRTYVYHTGSAP